MIGFGTQHIPATELRFFFPLAPDVSLDFSVLFTGFDFILLLAAVKNLEGKHGIFFNTHIHFQTAEMYSRSFQSITTSSLLPVTEVHKHKEVACKCRNALVVILKPYKPGYPVCCQSLPIAHNHFLDKVSTGFLAFRNSGLLTSVGLGWGAHAPLVLVTLHLDSQANSHS
jgi:hypothetical protein